MSLRINTNIMAFDTHRNMDQTNTLMQKSLEKLSSGLRINHASDDAAGLAIADNMEAQVRGLAQAERNAQDGISLINETDGALSNVTDVLQRMRELAVESANGTLTNSDRSATNSEFQALVSEIDNITSYTQFNGQSLLDGKYTFTFQVGANSGQTLVFTTQKVNSSGLTLTASKTDTQANAIAAISTLDTAIAAVSSVRAGFGAVSNRLQYTVNNVQVSQENISSAESHIRDVDMASEMTNLTRLQILMQSGTAMLAQANAAPQTVLKLLG
ncbi:MAG TPA: flagellin [Oscillatoriaceae cyanobacterium]